MQWLNCYRIRLIIVVFIVAIMVSGSNAKADFTWAKKTVMPITSFLPSANVLGGKIYVIGGWHAFGGEWNPQWEALTRVDVYDPVTDTWTRKADMPTGRGHTNACVVDGKIYVIGGDSGPGDSPIPTVEVYDPVTDTWTQKADMPTKRMWFSTCVVDGIIYVIGGNNGSQAGWTHLCTMEAYDPSTNTWTRKADMFTARSFLATCVVDGLIYAIGGGAPGKSAVEVYDPDTDTWTTKAPMPTARYEFGACVVNGKIYAIGGWWFSTTGPIYSTVEVYDTATDTWTSGFDIPVTTAGLSTCVVDEKIYNFGGTTVPHGSEHWILTSEVYTNVPIVDFNGDGIVDIDDLVIMIENWNTDNSLCDIGPMPWGDGVVDRADLEVLMEYYNQVVDAAAYYKLDETEGLIAYDSSGNYNDAIVIGDPNWQPDGGMVDGALEFDGIDDYLSTPFVLNPSDGEFSVFAWVKGGAPGQAIISQADNKNWLSTDASDGRLASELTSGRAAAPLISDVVITDSEWHRIGLTWDGSRKVLYADDMEVASDTKVGLGNSVDGLYIGAGKNREVGSFFSGLIDDVRIYNRAITP